MNLVVKQKSAPGIRGRFGVESVGGAWWGRCDVRFCSAGRLQPFAGRGGFTLIEIMVVVALLALILTMGIPAIYSALHRDPMTQTLKDLTEACRVARAQAIISGNPSVMRIYLTE